MDSSSDAHRRNRCAACYREFNKMEHLVDHMRASFHSPHEPRCGVCGKRCRSLDALRDHLTGSLPKPACAATFASRGCNLCLAVFSSSGALQSHRNACQLSRAPPHPPHPMQGLTRSMSRMGVQGGGGGNGGTAVALGCKMVGGGSDGTLDLCARVCLVNEHETILYESFIKPSIPVTHYRYESTGIRPEYLRDAPTAKQARRHIQDILNSEKTTAILVGHGLEHDLEALGMDHPGHLKRDTATYPPLMKTSGRVMSSNSLRSLTRNCLGYEIQTPGYQQHPYDDCVAAMRIYRRMRGLKHVEEKKKGEEGEGFPAWRQRELERMSPEELLRMSKPDYRCWCLDDGQ